MEFRKAVDVPKRTIGFFLEQGGSGDFICYSAAIDYVARKYDYVEGIVSAPAHMVGFVSNVLRKHDNWKVIPEALKRETIAPGTIVKVPSIRPINATMMHLLELGFLYYAEINPIPDNERFYPELDLGNTKLHGAVLSKNYAVMVPGSTCPSRTMTPKTFNEVKNYLIGVGIKPVFLGNDKMRVGKGEKYTNFNSQYDLTGGINLLNKTSIMEAAKIIEHSRLIVGIDNGLLHLAACTRAPIVFGYTIAGPKQRRPVRRCEAPIIDVVVTKDELSCIHCQEEMRYFENNFKHCLYKDYKCLDLLNADKFIEGIRSALYITY